MVHGSKVDGSSINGRLHGIVNMVVFNHVSALITKNKDTVTRKVLEMIVTNIVACDVIQDRSDLLCSFAGCIDLGIVHVG